MKKVQNIVTYGYIFLILVIFPLYFRDHYLQMSFNKWIFYLFVTLFFVAFILILLLVKGSVKFCGEGKKQTGTASRNIWVPDWLIMAYGFSNLITFFTCSSKQAAWMGTDSWYMGLVAQLLFVITYLIFSFGGVSEKVFLSFHYIGSALCFLIAVCQRYGEDILHLYWNMPAEVVRDYLSTIGNRSWFAGYVSTVFPLGLYYFWKTEERKWMRWTSIYVALTFCCIVTINADSIYPPFAIVIFVLALWSLDSRKQIEKMLYIMDIWGISCLAMSLLRLVVPTEVRELRGLSKIFLNLPFSIVFAIVLLGITWLYHHYDRCKPEKLRWMETMDANKWRRRIGIGTGVLGLTIITLVILNTSGVLQNISGVTIQNSYFYFDDQWGDSRGFNWRFAWEMYLDLPIKEKLFGVGQDCFAFYAYSIPEYVSRLQAVWGKTILANAHNEWLNCLICEGAVGAVFYLGGFLSVLYHSFKARKAEQSSPLVPGIGLCIIGYMVNNIFGYQQTSATAVIFIYMGVAMYYTKKIREAIYIKNDDNIGGKQNAKG